MFRQKRENSGTSRLTIELIKLGVLDIELAAWFINQPIIYSRKNLPFDLLAKKAYFFCCLQVLGAATSVAKHTSALCNACKAASAKTSNPAAKRQFVQSAKDVANNTANLVKNIKVCACI